MRKNYRYEIKFILDNAHLSRIYQWIKERTFVKKTYPNRQVNSLYFDDINYTSVQDNLAGISDRQKMRLRWYGKEEDTNSPSFEFKLREGRLNWKECFPVERLEKNLLKFDLKDILFECKNELFNQRVILDEYILPTLQTGYEREYYADAEGIRLTIDHNIIFHNPMLHKILNHGCVTEYPLKVMEIKFDPVLKDNVARIIKSLHLTPKRHSKYLVGLAKQGFVTYI